MAKTCPNCNYALQPYHQFCPECDTNVAQTASVVYDNSSVSGASDIQDGQPELSQCVCPYCGKPISDPGAPFCIWCDADLGSEIVNEQPEEQSSVQEAALNRLHDAEQSAPLSSADLKGSQSCCPECGKPVTSNSPFCIWCDADLNGSVQESPPPSQQAGRQRPPRQPQSGQEETDPSCTPSPGSAQNLHMSGERPLSESVVSVVQPAQAGRAAPQQQFMQALEFVQSSVSWNMDGAVPLGLWFNQGNRLRQNCQCVLDFGVSNISSDRIRDLRLEVDSGSRDGCHAGSVNVPLASGCEARFPVRGFRPGDRGNYALRVMLCGQAERYGEFHLSGELVVKVHPETDQEMPQSIQVNINAEGPAIIRAENAVSDLQEMLHQNQTMPVEQEQFVPVALYWDIPAMQSAQRRFPAACIPEHMFEVPEDALHALRMMPPRTAAQAVLSTSLGFYYKIIPGTMMTLGKSGNCCDVPAVLHPPADFESHNARISRQHCQLKVERNKVMLVDHSANGTFVNDRLIGKGKQRQLSDGDHISLSHQLDMDVSIYTDGLRVIAVRLKRTNNWHQEGYLLAVAHIPVGGSEQLPVTIPSAPPLSSAFYYHSRQRTWVQQFPGSSPPMQDSVIAQMAALEFSACKCWFSIARSPQRDG